MTNDMNAALERLFDKAAEDYRKFTLNFPPRDRTINEAEAKFRNNFSVKVGKKFIKVVNEHSAFAFIVKDDFIGKDGKEWKRGDLLMAAAWSTPALNRARGNIFEEEYTVRWTGPEYLRG